MYKPSSILSKNIWGLEVKLLAQLVQLLFGNEVGSFFYLHNIHVISNIKQSKCQKLVSSAFKKQVKGILAVKDVKRRMKQSY